PRGAGGLRVQCGVLAGSCGRPPLHHRDPAVFDVLPDPARAFGTLADRDQPARDHPAEHLALPTLRRDRPMTRTPFPILAALPVATRRSPPARSPPPPATGRSHTRLSTPPSRVVPVDRIIAVVNDEVLTYNDLTERVQLVIRQIQRQGGQLPAADALQRQILE